MADTIKKIPLDQLSESTNLDDNDITIFQDESGTHKTKFKTLYDKVCNKVKEKFVNWVFDVKTKDKTLPGAINELLAANTQLNTDLSNHTFANEINVYEGNGWTMQWKKIGYHLIYIDLTKTFSDGIPTPKTGDLEMVALPFNPIVGGMVIPAYESVAGRMISAGYMSIRENASIVSYLPSYGNPISIGAYGIVSVKDNI